MATTAISALDLNLMSSPLNVVQYSLQDMESRMEDGKYTITDPNSVALHLIESNAIVVSQLAKLTQNELEKQNPARAMTTKDLMRHMSDYDYVDLYASPSHCTIKYYIHKEYIANNGVNINDNYRLLKIPKDTVFTIGDLQFSLYYDVNIQIDIRAGIPLVTYDINDKNPLFPMETNRVTFFEYPYQGMTLLVMNLDVYQFTRTRKSEVMTSAIGFTKKYNYTDKFYAVRLFTTVKDKTVELSQSMVQDAYDPYTPTARVDVEPDDQSFTINIPQIYFAKNLVGSNLDIELYTTKGDISVNIGSTETTSIRVDLFANPANNNNKYVEPLRRVVTAFCDIVSTMTTGGSDGMDIDTLRKKVIYDSYTTEVIVTPRDFESYFVGTDITVAKYNDDLTDLTYYAYKLFKDSESSVIPVTNSYLVVTPTTPETVSTITKNPDGSMTLLPKTYYRFDETENSCIPQDDTTINRWATATKENLVEIFNKDTYVRTPFHIRLDTSETYPAATAYNLMDPEITEVTVTEESPTIAAQMVISSETIEHLDSGSGGYKLRFFIKKDVLDDVPNEDCQMYIYTSSSDGVLIGMYGTYTMIVDESFYVYEFNLATSYYIDDSGNIDISSLTDGNSELTYSIPLLSKFHVVFMVPQKYYPTSMTPESLFVGIPQTERVDKCVLLRQSMKVNLGYSLNDVILNEINLTWSSNQYLRYEQDVTEKYTSDAYVTDDQGIPIYKIEDGKLVLTKLATKGESLLTSEGEALYKTYASLHPEKTRDDYIATLTTEEELDTLVMWKYRIGDVVRDDHGDPIITEARVQKYMISAMVFSAALYISEHPTQKSFVTNLTKELETYFKLLRNVHSRIRERTKLYFRPKQTFGTAKFGVGDGVTMILPIAMSFAFRAHVDDAVFSDINIKNAVTESIIDIIEDMVAVNPVSETKIAEMIKEQISYVSSVDALGILGNADLQTVTIMDDGIQPSVAQTLYLTADNTIALEKSIDVSYVTKAS